MKSKIIPKQETVPSFAPKAVAVKYMEYYAPNVWIELLGQRSLMA